MTAPAGRFEVGILLFDGVEELDFAGPYEVFGVAAEVGLDVGLTTIGLTGDRARASKGLVMLADRRAAHAPALDIAVMPGGIGTRTLMKDPAALATVRKLAEPCRWVMSVCTGSLVLGAAGLLDGRRATTHWNHIADLRAVAPHSSVVDDRRYVVDGNVITSAGVSAGIDASLWLVGHLFGPEAGGEVQKWMEYYPEPPFGRDA
jgi:transcriptional regulator GlxA family with amidase domain